ncbi:MAG: DUF4339 domain-containing protein [Bacteriovorax sp.]|nr:DUF4339 domain-containing protein [Bacteriovorax sp.]
MINWYYVQGSERIGPVVEDALRDLYLKEEITLDSYVWRKGFPNWERLKDVEELNFHSPRELLKLAPERRVEKIEKVTSEKIVIQEENSPDITLDFDWHAVGEEEELFFIKVGHDRKSQVDSELFGPYSLSEIRDALEEKRINNQSLLFAIGMQGWIKVGDTPLNPKNLKINVNNILDDAPLLIVVKNIPHPLIALVEVAGTKKCTLLGAGPFQVGKDVLCSMYSGTALKARNLKLNIDEYRPREQKIFCSVIEISESAKKIMQNYAD